MKALQFGWWQPVSMRRFHFVSGWSTRLIECTVPRLFCLCASGAAGLKLDCGWLADKLDEQSQTRHKPKNPVNNRARTSVDLTSHENVSCRKKTSVCMCVAVSPLAAGTELTGRARGRRINSEKPFPCYVSTLFFALKKPFTRKRGRHTERFWESKKMCTTCRIWQVLVYFCLSHKGGASNSLRLGHIRAERIFPSRSRKISWNQLKPVPGGLTCRDPTGSRMLLQILADIPIKRRNS
jgi:hypothetical protein